MRETSVKPKKFCPNFLYCKLQQFNFYVIKIYTDFMIINFYNAIFYMILTRLY